ncbi:MAG: hypothetical protein R3B49_05115 [Phycisphaerales bacterium]
MLRSRRAGVPTMLLMDGVVEHQQHLRQPRVGEGFLRSRRCTPSRAPGETCADVLTELGNDAWATGLPCLDHLPNAHARGATVVVATANTPFFDEHEPRSARARVRDPPRHQQPTSASGCCGD